MKAMGLMDKVKKLLFDEDEIEVPVKSDELPKREVKKEVEESKSSSRYSMYNAYDEVKMRENTSNSSFHAGLQEDKDYKKLIKTEEKEKDKKPFKVTPVISPVYGYIDVDKKIVEPKKVEIKEEKTQIRNFGPVSYNSEKISKAIEKEETVVPSIIILVIRYGKAHPI